MKSLRRRFIQNFSGPSVVQKQFKDSCDVNRIIDNYKATGVIDSPNEPDKQQFGFASSKSYFEAKCQLAEIDSAFSELPSQERARFANDPKNWLDEQSKANQGEDEIIPPIASEDVSEETPKISPEKGLSEVEKDPE